MRFIGGKQGVLPILSAVAPESTLSRPDGPHEGNPAVRAAVKLGEPQIVAWVRERPDGARGFGFTGGHYHKNWGNDDFRKLVLNAILWTAKVEVPTAGVNARSRKKTCGETWIASDITMNALPLQSSRLQQGPDFAGRNILPRGLALFLGGFALVNILGGLRSAHFDANLWWIDLRGCPRPL